MKSTSLLALGLTLCLSFIKVDTECPVVSSFGDRRKDNKSLRLVQYNVEWLFIDYYSAMDCPGDGCTWHSVADAETHLSYVANVVKNLQPDIINFVKSRGVMN